jgi:hypothetical protein
MRERFHSIIASRVPDLWIESLVYSVLIMEDFNRPALSRWVERYVLFPFKLASTLGPMQVSTDRPLSDHQSVELGTTKIVSLYPEAAREHARTYLNIRADEAVENTPRPLSPHDRYFVARLVAVKYNPDGPYADEVQSLYESLIRRFYPTLLEAGH